MVGDAATQDSSDVCHLIPQLDLPEWGEKEEEQQAFVTSGRLMPNKRPREHCGSRCQLPVSTALNEVTLKRWITLTSAMVDSIRCSSNYSMVDTQIACTSNSCTLASKQKPAPATLIAWASSDIRHFCYYTAILSDLISFAVPVYT